MNETNPWIVPWTKLSATPVVQYHNKIGTVIIPILQVRKLGHRGIKWLIHNQSASKWHKQNLSLYS